MKGENHTIDDVDDEMIEHSTGDGVDGVDDLDNYVDHAET